jgi:hypothetical protein
MLPLTVVTVYPENHMQPAKHYKDKIQRFEPAARWYTPLCIIGISLVFGKVIRVEVRLAATFTIVDVTGILDNVVLFVLKKWYEN